MRFDSSLINSVQKEDYFNFSKHTTYGLGGTARIAYFPKTEQEGLAVFGYVTENFNKFVVLGNGSNVLASDKPYGGAVISTKLLTEISYNNGIITCASGITVNQLLKFCIENGLSGLEYLAGIPASIGGIVYMNGGVFDKHIEDNVKSVTVCNENKISILTKQDCKFSNKHSTMRDINCLILSVDLLVTKSNSETVEQNIAKQLAVRKFQPTGRSCGCVFKNPEGKAAGMLIDETGLKGLTIGNAEVSREHANFIINKGNSSSDVYKLIQEVKRRVFEKHGIKLEEEVIYIGEFNDFDS